MTDNNTKIRSLILAALMVFSVFAGTVAISGTAVATHTNTQDASLEDGMTYWQGQQLGYGGDASNDADSDGTYQIRDTEDGGLVSEVTADGDGHVLVDSSDLEPGIYNLTDGEGNVVVSNFEIVVQDLSATFADDTVDNNDETTLELDSNRGSYNASVTATMEGDEVSEDVLAEIFENAETGAADDGTVYVDGTSSASITANFTDVSTGNYTFTVSATDTTATDTANITVRDAAEGDVTFSQSTYEVPQGDIADMTVEFDGDASTATVVIGDQSESGYQANVTVRDADDDGEVTVMFNTYTAGGQNGDVISVSDGDEIVGSASETSLSSILEQGDYGIAVALGDQTGDEVLSSPDDVGTLYINERSTDAMNIWTSPVNPTSDDATLTQDSSIAAGDWVVHEVEASGLAGLVGDELTASDFDGNSLELSVMQTEDSTPQNTPAKTLKTSALSGSNVELWADSANDTYYIAYKTGENGAQFEREDSAKTFYAQSGDEFTAEFTVNDSALYSEEAESVSATYEIAEGSVSIDEPVTVTASENQTISGTSTFAPGTTFQVKIESTGDTQPRFFESEQATVQEDGSWSVTFDRFAEQSAGDTFMVTANGDVEADGEVVEATPTNTTTDNGTATATATATTTATATATDDGTATATATATDEEPGTETATETDGETPTGTSEETPGFGVVVALVALVAAALLAVRRD